MNEFTCSEISNIAENIKNSDDCERKSACPSDGLDRFLIVELAI